MQGPERYLNELGITLPGAVHPDQSAVLDEAHRIFLNYETYFVSSVEARDAFLASPEAYCGRITDPVSRMRFTPVANSPRREHGGRVFLFESDETAATFDSAPDDYATPMLTMVQKAE